MNFHSQVDIKVGIKTLGYPDIKVCGDYTILENMLIGDNFHWQRVIPVKLPGKIEVLKTDNQSDPNSGSYKNTDRNISIINQLPLETYIECVVGSEMNPEAPFEFLKAHAVISRSWALGKILGMNYNGDFEKTDNIHTLINWEDNTSHSGFHVCSDDHCQRYQGLQPISEKALAAIRDTAGEVLVSPENDLIDTRFSKCCGGKTEFFSTCWQSMDPPGLESFTDPWCDLSNMSSNSRRALLKTILKDYDFSTEGYGLVWQSKISKKEIKDNLQKLFHRNIGDILNIEVLHRGASGRIDLIRITGSNSYLEIGKELMIRRLLSSSHLLSSWFQIEDKGDSLLLKGRGWGHGVGLCQIGAANMATQGCSYQDILSFYYPGSHITS